MWFVLIYGYVCYFTYFLNAVYVIQTLCEAYARILRSLGIATANRPYRTLRNILVHPKDKIKDEEKTELIIYV